MSTTLDPNPGESYQEYLLRVSAGRESEHRLPETPKERILREARENAVADTAWKIFEEKGGGDIRSGHDAARRYRETLERLSTKAGVKYGRRP